MQVQALAHYSELQRGGETHGEGLGVVVDGCPTGLPISKEDIQQYLNRRKPGQSKYTTPGKRMIEAEILSGV